MSRFKVGMKVVCIVDEWAMKNNYSRAQRWWYVLTGRMPNGFGPRKGDVLRVYSIHESEGRTYLVFTEYPAQCYSEESFAPVDPLEEQLDRIESEGAPAEVSEAHAYQLMGGKKEWA